MGSKVSVEGGGGYSWNVVFGFVQPVDIHKPIDKLERRVDDGFGFAHAVVYCDGSEGVS